VTEHGFGTRAAGAALFFIIAPGSMAGLVPYLLTHGQVEAGLPPAVRVGGAVLIGISLISVVESFARFVVRGRGTPAPIAAPTHLVVSGQYRHVRNPMYVALVLAVVGQAIVLGSWTLATYAAFLLVLFHGRVITYEEPRLAAQFGPQFAAYRAGVPRWLPRITPWRGELDEEA
jgi:protein-S-isoprenylcysteine O-methyltransferase Ste14